MKLKMAGTFALCLHFSTAYADCGCGPDFCSDDPRVSAALAKKKQELASIAPPRLVKLFKGNCVAAITRAPDDFHMLIVTDEDHKMTIEWSSDDEDIAKRHLADKTIKRYWIFNSSRALACCNEPKYDERADYDGTDDLNTSAALLCDSRHPC